MLTAEDSGYLEVAVLVNMNNGLSRSASGAYGQDVARMQVSPCTGSSCANALLTADAVLIGASAGGAAAFVLVLVAVIAGVCCCRRGMCSCCGRCATPVSDGRPMTASRQQRQEAADAPWQVREDGGIGGVAVERRSVGGRGWGCSVGNVELHLAVFITRAMLAISQCL